MGRSTRGVAFLLISLAGVVLTACASSDGRGSGTWASTVEDCRQEFSPEGGHGYESDTSLRTAGTGDAAPPQGPGALDQAVSDCIADGGSDCSTSQVLTHDAALCLARALGMAQGLREWRANIVYNYRLRRIIWHVENTLHSSPDGSSGGDAWLFDAHTGALIEKHSWDAIP